MRTRVRRVLIEVELELMVYAKHECCLQVQYRFWALKSGLANCLLSKVDQSKILQTAALGSLKLCCVVPQQP